MPIPRRHPVLLVLLFLALCLSMGCSLGIRQEFGSEPAGSPNAGFCGVDDAAAADATTDCLVLPEAELTPAPGPALNLPAAGPPAPASPTPTATPTATPTP